MNIAIFCATDIGIRILEALRRHGQRPCCLVLDDADPQDLKQRMTELAGADHVLTASELTREEGLARIKGLNLDLAILAWWPHIITPEILAAARLGFLNHHPSLLPYNRGKHYYFWNIVEEVPFGVSIHLVTPDIDAGDIVYQRPLGKTWEDTGASLRDRSIEALVELFEEHVDEIASGRFPRTPQDLSRGGFHWGRELEQGSRLDLDGSYTGRQVLNLLRARSGFPHGGAWFEDEGQRYEVTVNIRKTRNG